MRSGKNPEERNNNPDIISTGATEMATLIDMREDKGAKPIQAADARQAFFTGIFTLLA